MRVLKYLMALWAAAAVYSILSVSVGAMGISAYNQLKEERNNQQANLETLRLINRELEGDMDALRYDSDTIEVYARELGYGRAGTGFARIVGLGGFKKPRTIPGRLIPLRYPGAVSNKTLRIISLMAGLAVFIVLGIPDLLKRRRPRPNGPP
jgi:cell division protein FtsB